MTKISGIYAATMSVLNSDLSLNVKKTIEHAEKLIDEGCHGTAIFGSTGQSQLISVSEKIKLLNELSKSKYKSKHLIGTGLNSLGETINFMKIASSLSFDKFLIMPPAYYKYDDAEVIEFYTKILESVPDCKIILYNFEKLSGYKFNKEIVKKLKSDFSKNIIGCKDSSYNLFQDLKLKDFLIFPGSEAKLLEGLELGCAGCISAVTNVTHSISRKVFDDFNNNQKQEKNKLLIQVRELFDKYHLISAVHSYLGVENNLYNNLLPPLELLKENDLKNLLKELDNLKFGIKIAA